MAIGTTPVTMIIITITTIIHRLTATAMAIATVPATATAVVIHPYFTPDTTTHILAVSIPAITIVIRTEMCTLLIPK